MTNPEYRRQIQVFADLVIDQLPKIWVETSLRVAFTGPVSTQFEFSFRAHPGAQESWPDVPMAEMRALSEAARSIRGELVRAGNPECKGFIFRLTREGRSSIDVEY